MAFLGICIVLSTWIACDTWIFLNGYESTFHKARTEEEKAIHDAIIKRNTKV